MALRSAVYRNAELFDGDLVSPKGLAKEPVSLSRVDMGTHFQCRFSITPGKSGAAGEEFTDCLGQLEAMLRRDGIGLGNAVQMSVFVPSEGYEASRLEFQRRLWEYFGGPELAPPASFIGQTPADGKKAALDGIAVAPKEGHALEINPPRVVYPGSGVGRINPAQRMSEEEIESALLLSKGSLEGAGDAVYSVAVADGRTWVYGAGLEGNPNSKSAAEKARGAFAKEIAILLKEGIFREGALANIGLLNSRHYVHDIVGDNYNHLNNARKEAYRKARLFMKYPSATGIGMFSAEGDIILEFVSAEGVGYEVIESGKHGEAWQYSTDWLAKQVGGSIGLKGEGSGAGMKVSKPLFSRALYLPAEGVMLVSGTASVENRKLLYGASEFDRLNQEQGGSGVLVGIDDIVGSVGVKHLKDAGLNPIAMPNEGTCIRAGSAVEAQTWATVRNIARLLGRKGKTIRDMAQTRVYVEDLADAPKVMGLCERLFENKPSLCVHGPVCYKGWLVEIEGIA